MLVASRSDSELPAWRPAIAALLFLLVVGLYLPAGDFSFVNLDDNDYVTENPFVRSGLSSENVRWALTAYHSGHWHPLTWLSLMTDCHWWGMDAGPLHLVNVLLHAAGTALFFLWLRAATGCLWRSALVAALFALHPLRVESVAWVAARKDVLSGFFLMLTMWAWVRYAKRPSVVRYVLAALAFGLGLLAKPTLAIVPCGLVLLDHWPLGRRALHARAMPDQGAGESQAPSYSLAWLIAEKLPLLALAFLTLRQTWAAQQAAGAVVGDSLALPARIANALWNYAQYLGRTFWPFELAVFYPLHPVALLYASLAAALLAGVTALAWRLRATMPWLLVGWLWFAGTLLPVSGLIQFGGQSMADRYAYIPHIGLLMALVWTGAELLKHIAPWRSAVAVALLAALALRTTDQLGYWRDSITLFTRALEVTTGNYMAHNNLGVALEAAGRREEAAHHYGEAVRINPTWPEALNNFGIAHAWRSDYAGARRQFEEALRIRPRFAKAANNVATAYGREGNFEAAVPYYQRAVEIDARYFDARYALADALEKLGRHAEARNEYVKVLELRPDFGPARAALERLNARGVR